MTRGEAGGSSRPWVAALLGGIVGGLLGSLMTSWARGDANQQSELRGLDALDRHLQELTSELRARPLGLSGMSPQVDAVGESSPPVERLQPNPSTDLTPLLTRLDALLARLEVSGVAGSAPFQFPDEAAMDAARRELFAADHMTVIRSHRLMTYRQIAERYGQPDGTYLNEDGSVSWRYEREDGSGLSFTFYDGLCR